MNSHASDLIDYAIMVDSILRRDYGYSLLILLDRFDSHREDLKHIVRSGFDNDVQPSTTTFLLVSKAHSYGPSI